MAGDIVVIGPARAGKSTLSRLLADALGKARYSLDQLRLRYYEEIGYDAAFADELLQKEGHWALGQYWSEFECHAVERLLSEVRDCVVDFGAGHSVYENDNQLGRVRRALAPFPHVVLVMPCPDLDACVRILNERNGFEPLPGRINPIEHHIRHRSNFQLARFTVYTEGRSPEQTRDEVLALIDC